MGNQFGQYTKKDVLILGLDGAGKTALLSTLKMGNILTFTGTHYETIDVNGVSLSCLDLSGRNKERPMIHLSTPTAAAFIHVVDSSDKVRLDQSLDELIKFVLLEKKTSGTVVMVLANKQDIPGCMSALEIQEALTLKYTFSPNSSLAHTVFVRQCSVLTKEGMHEALGEFVEQMQLKRSGHAKPGLLSLDEQNKVDDVHGSSGKLRKENQNDSVALSKVKAFFKNPFCLFQLK
ncbi:ADP-ribosylation factor 1 [Elysia marginata]|uniref:ADP-ribosylation factor 1 n=1 Tax=Elysia marginata TaxID=1093978 RepID=A0AAV4FGP0_9GAST|nr:ADP-ribosylation factor 1 [Elysia marginata]